MVSLSQHLRRSACQDAPVHVRPYAPEDAETVLALNQAELDAVSSLDRPGLDRLVGLAEEVAVVDDAGAIAGFAVVLAPASGYESFNYAWFGERYTAFHYLDRVVVAPSHRRRGVGSMLYAHLEDHARSVGRLLCEVYSDPPNVASLAFHAARGYAELGRLRQQNGKTCTMFGKEMR